MQDEIYYRDKELRDIQQDLEIANAELLRNADDLRRVSEHHGDLLFFSRIERQTIMTNINLIKIRKSLLEKQ